jgi:hypothetical protein
MSVLQPFLSLCVIASRKFVVSAMYLFPSLEVVTSLQLSVFVG